MKKAGIYIHIPFCAVKCMYCDFYSIADQNDQIPSFIEALIKEIKISKMLPEGRIFDTVFIGKSSIANFFKLFIRSFII